MVYLSSDILTQRLLQRHPPNIIFNIMLLVRCLPTRLEPREYILSDSTGRRPDNGDRARLATRVNGQ
jgi:hypothetical protein